MTEQLLAQQLESPSETGRVEPRSDRQLHITRHQQTGCHQQNPFSLAVLHCDEAPTSGSDPVRNPGEIRPRCSVRRIDRPVGRSR